MSNAAVMDGPELYSIPQVAVRISRSVDYVRRRFGPAGDPRLRALVRQVAHLRVVSAEDMDLVRSILVRK